MWFRVEEIRAKDMMFHFHHFNLHLICFRGKEYENKKIFAYQLDCYVLAKYLFELSKEMVIMACYGECIIMFMCTYWWIFEARRMAVTNALSHSCVFISRTCLK